MPCLRGSREPIEKKDGDRRNPRGLMVHSLLAWMKLRYYPC
jgi:hypothetical protein